jgi:hypothetical protein
MPKKLTSREKLKKLCRVEGDAVGGVVLIHGKTKYRSDGGIDEMTDAECDRVLEAMGKGAPLPAAGKTKAAPAAKLCECGCKKTVGPQARFRPGHDMRLKCALRKAAVNSVRARKELRARQWTRT